MTLFLKQIVYLDPEVKKEDTNKEGVTEQDSQELENVLENTEIKIITELMNKVDINGEPIVSQKVDKNNNPVFSTEAGDVRTEVKTEIMDENKLTKLLDNAQSVLDKKSDYLRNNSEFLVVFNELANRFSKNITTKDQLKSVLGDSGYNGESLSDTEISTLFDILNTGKGGDKEKVKVLQLVMIKLNSQFHDILNQNGGIDGLAGEKTLEVLDKFLNQLKIKSEIWKMLDIKPIKALISNEVKTNLEDFKPNEVYEIIFPEEKIKYLDISVTGSGQKAEGDEISGVNETNLSYNKEYTNQIKQNRNDALIQTEVGYNINERNLNLNQLNGSAQINIDKGINTIKNKKDKEITGKEFMNIIQEAKKGNTELLENFVNHYMRHNNLTEEHPLEFSLKPKINPKNPEKDIKVIKNNNNTISIYLDNEDKPTHTFLRKGKIEGTVQISGNNNIYNGKSPKFGGNTIHMNTSVERPLDENNSIIGGASISKFQDPNYIQKNQGSGEAYLGGKTYLKNGKGDISAYVNAQKINNEFDEFNREAIFGGGIKGNYNFNENSNMSAETTRNQINGIEAKGTYSQNFEKGIVRAVSTTLGYGTGTMINNYNYMSGGRGKEIYTNVNATLKNGINTSISASKNFVGGQVNIPINW